MRDDKPIPVIVVKMGTWWRLGFIVLILGGMAMIWSAGVILKQALEDARAKTGAGAAGHLHAGTFAYNLGGVSCSCPAHGWDRARFGREMFWSDEKNYIYPHVSHAVYIYIFTGSVPISFLITYLNESLEEFLLLSTSTWGFNFHTDMSTIETRYDSLLRDTVLCGGAGILCGFVILKRLRAPRLLRWPPALSHSLALENSAARYAVVVVEFMLLGLPRLMFTPQSKTFDFEHYNTLYYAFSYFAFLMGLYAINFLLGFWADARDAETWKRVHVAWSLLYFVLYVFSYVSLLPAMTAVLIICPVISAVFWAALPHFRVSHS